MYHLDNTSGVPEMPEPKETQTISTRWFGESQEQGGISWPGADWFNVVQAELLNLLAAAGIEPEKHAYDQLSKAIPVLGDAVIRQNLGSGDEGMGDYLLAAKLTVDGAVHRTQHDKNAESMSLMDFGGDRDAVNPLGIEAEARARATSLRIPYLGYDQYLLPNMGAKLFKYCDGPYDRSVVMALRNQLSPMAGEPQSSISGFATSADLSKNPERAQSLLYGHLVGQPTLLTSSNTVFSADSVTCTDLPGDIISEVCAKQVINVVDSDTSVGSWTTFVLGIVGTTIYIEDTWYKAGSNGTVTGVPTDGSMMKLVPSNKIFGRNFIVSLNEDSDASQMVGEELNLRNNKAAAAGSGYGQDVISNGLYNIMNAFQARGKSLFGFRNYANHSDGASGYGFANTPSVGNSFYGFYDVNSTNGLYVWTNQYGVTIKNPQSQALRVIDNSNNFITGLDETGSWQIPKEYSTTTVIGATVSSFAGVTFATPAAAGDAIIMPTRMKNKKLKVKNLSATYALTLTGPFEFGAGSFSIPARGGVILETDGTYWYILAKYTA
ncbi:hypothetical protein ACQFN5_27960 [Klebsiella sp. WOUb02]|uniref:hypothetical protein n=1 Tax=Klebsiella sp. WOUb02 TaxID=3161071 RepID=UPI003CEF3693